MRLRIISWRETVTHLEREQLCVVYIRVGVVQPGALLGMPLSLQESPQTSCLVVGEFIAVGNGDHNGREHLPRQRGRSRNAVDEHN